MVLLYPENEPSLNNCPLLANFGEKMFGSLQKLRFGFNVDNYDKIPVKVHVLEMIFKTSFMQFKV